MRIGVSDGIDLAIGRRARQVLRQLPGGGVDRGLDVVGRGVDVAIEIELHGDRGRAERARRRHLRYAGDLRDLPLERLGDRRGHRLGRGAGQRGADRDGRESRSAAAARPAAADRRPGRRAGSPPSASVVATGWRMKGPEMPPYIASAPAGGGVDGDGRARLQHVLADRHHPIAVVHPLSITARSWSSCETVTGRIAARF